MGRSQKLAVRGAAIEESASLPRTMTIPDSAESRRTALIRAVRRHRQRLARKLDAIRGDLDEARRGPAYRRSGEALLAYLRQVPARAATLGGGVPVAGRAGTASARITS